MARSRKFETIEFPEYKQRIDIRFEPYSNLFTASVHGVSMSSTDIADLKKRIKKALQVSNEIEFMPIIVATTTKDGNKLSNGDIRIGLGFERYYIGLMVETGQLYKIDWGHYEHLTERGTELLGPSANPMYIRLESPEYSALMAIILGKPQGPREGMRYSASEHVLRYPYSDELWNGLKMLEEAIREIGKKMDVLLSPDLLIRAAIKQGDRMLIEAG